MARILAIDYGIKRSGLAVTDPLQIIVNGLDTVETKELLNYLKNYCKKELVEKIIIGWPIHKDGSPTYVTEEINKFIADWKKQLPEIPIQSTDERFTSVRAKSIIIQSGARKKTRQDKALIDKISAVVILQRFLGHY